MMDEKYWPIATFSPSRPGILRSTPHNRAASTTSGIAMIQDAICQAIVPMITPSMAGPMAFPRLPPMP